MQKLRSPLMLNAIAPIIEPLPDDITLEDAVQRAEAYGPSFFYLNGVTYKYLYKGLFEMHPNNTPKRKIDTPSFPLSERQRRKRERKKEMKKKETDKEKFPSIFEDEYGDGMTQEPEYQQDIDRRKAGLKSLDKIIKEIQDKKENSSKE